MPIINETRINPKEINAYFANRAEIAVFVGVFHGDVRTSAFLGKFFLLVTLIVEDQN
jgi:hypothetical protein